MSSINSLGSTLNSINQSLLTEIGSFMKNQASSSANTNASGTASTDTLNFSQVGQLFQELSQLQTSNPAEFKQVVTDAANKLTAAASQATDPAQAQFLTNLADKFQQAAQDGNMTPFEQSASASGASGAHGHHHHHHGGGEPPSSTSSTSDSSSTSSTTSASQNPLSSLFATGTTDVQSLLASILGANS